MADFIYAPGAMPDPRQGRDKTLRMDMFRPYLRVEMVASVVPGDTTDTNRWYQFLGGIPLAGETWEGSSGELTYIDSKGSAKHVLHASNAISSLMANDSLSNQSAQISFLRSDLASGLAELARPMDRLRIELKHPWAPAPFRWTLFDGLLGSINTTTQGGAGFSSHLSINASGIQTLLQNAIFNWQGFVHPASSKLLEVAGNTLFERLSHVAVPPHEAIQIIIECLLSSSMGLLVGDVTKGNLRVMDNDSASSYVKFGSGSQWTSLPAVANPLPWVHIASQSGQSFWNLLERISEPYLHEFFVGYRPYGDNSQVDVPTLIHRPRPFPGDTDFYNGWDLLDVVRVGASNEPIIMGSSDVRGGSVHPNCFHWAGGGIGDASMEAFLSKLQFGWYISEALVNRYGYAPAGLVTNVAPLVSGTNKIADPKGVTDWQTFGNRILKNYAMQECPLALLGQRTLQAPFIPVRPGQILVDYSGGSADSAAITGYVVSTSFEASVGEASCSMNMRVDVDRAIYGTNAQSYPKQVQALVPDLQQKRYAGTGIGDLGKAPAVGGTVPIPAAQKPKPGSAKPFDSYIKAAASRQGIPAWLLAHVAQQESGMGRNTGTNQNGAIGVCQIEPVCVVYLAGKGYKNPDGTTFTLSNRGNPEKNIHAAAAYIKACKSLMSNAGATSAYIWVWTLAAYRYGPTATSTYGNSIGWVPPASDWNNLGIKKEYARYWSAAGIANGKAIWGYLGS